MAISDFFFTFIGSINPGLDGVFRNNFSDGLEINAGEGSRAIVDNPYNSALSGGTVDVWLRDNPEQGIENGRVSFFAIAGGDNNPFREASGQGTFWFLIQDYTDTPATTLHPPFVSARGAYGFGFAAFPDGTVSWVLLSQPWDRQELVVSAAPSFRLAEAGLVTIEGHPFVAGDIVTFQVEWQVGDALSVDLANPSTPEVRIFIRIGAVNGDVEGLRTVHCEIIDYATLEGADLLTRNLNNGRPGVGNGGVGLVAPGGEIIRQRETATGRAPFRNITGLQIDLVG